MHRSGIADLLVPLILTIACFAQQKPAQRVAAFNAADYPAGKFQVSKRDFANGDVTVRVIQVKNLGYTMKPDECRAWLEVRKGERTVKRFYYADMNPVGSSFGIFVPKQQPIDDYFAAVKEGDYDGRLLLVRKDGETQDLPGGFFFLTADRRFLVSEYSSDLNEVSVFDLKENRKVFEARNLPQIGSWYQDESGYFFMEVGKPGHAERLDIEKGRFFTVQLSQSNIRKARRVQYDFDARKMKDCTSEPQ